MGHVHLKVAAIADTVAFYRDVLGFALMAQLGAVGGVSRRRRLPPSHRRQHLGERRRVTAAAEGPPRCATRRSRCPTSPSATVSSAASPRVVSTPRETAAGQLVHDPSGNALVLTLA